MHQAPAPSNTTRVEVPGAGAVHWAVAHIRPNSRNLFQFEFMIVPEPGVAASSIFPSVVAPGVLVAENTYEISSRQLDLDASQSTVTAGGEMTYSWTSAPGYPAPSISQADSSKPRVQFPSRGTYQVLLTITDRIGNSVTTAIIIRYV